VLPEFFSADVYAAQVIARGGIPEQRL
jgi:hypothetical protein